MANVHGFGDLNPNNPGRNNPIRNPMLGGYNQGQSMDVMNEEIRQNRVPFLNSMDSNKHPLEQSIPYTLKLVWCPTLDIFSVTTFYLVAIWIMYILCLTQGIDTSKHMVLAPRISTLMNFGAISYKTIHEGQVWRLITAAFLHADLMHIVMNTISLLFFLSRLEKCYNSKIILVFCLVSAICGNLTSVNFLDKKSTSVGASTVIFGTMGGLLSYMTINWNALGRIRSQLCCIVGIITFIAILSSLNGEVDIAGHFGGLVGGYACGLALFPGIKPKPKKTTIIGASTLGAFLLTLLLVFYL